MQPQRRQLSLLSMRRPQARMTRRTISPRSLRRTLLHPRRMQRHRLQTSSLIQMGTETTSGRSVLHLQLRRHLPL
jgi:hypothetical protein